MWYASIAKFTAVAATLLVATGIVWAAQQGGGEAKSGAAANGVELQAVPAVAAESDEATVVAFIADRREGEKAAKEEQLRKRDELAQMIQGLREELDAKTDQRAEMAADLEVQELEKDLLKRELDYLHETLVQLKNPSPTHEAESDEARKTREKNLIEVAERLYDTKEAFEKQLRRTAAISAGFESHSRERESLQRQLEELQRLLAQLDFEHVFAPRRPPATRLRPEEQGAAERLPPTGRLMAANVVDSDKERILQDALRELQRVLGLYKDAAKQLQELREENAELKQQLELRDERAEISP